MRWVQFRNTGVILIYISEKNCFCNRNDNYLQGFFVFFCFSPEITQVSIVKVNEENISKQGLSMFHIIDLI